MGQILIKKKAEIDAEINKQKSEELAVAKFKQKTFGNLSPKEKDELLQLIAKKMGLID